MIRKFFNKLKSYSEISNFEREGFFALLFILLLVICYSKYRSSHPPQYVPLDEVKLAELQNEIDQSFVEKSTTDNKQSSSKKALYPAKSTKKLLLFNPNTDDLAQLLNKGIPYKLAKNIENYKNKGGVFHTKEDVAKLYSISDADYTKLAPFVDLPSKPTAGSQYANSQSKYVPHKKEIAIVNINRATKADLENLPGIGSYYAKMIVNFRDKLGGYYSYSQMYEVYNVPKEVVDSIKQFVELDSQEISKISINTATKDDLARHPYLSYSEAKAIISYREQHGEFTQINQISKLHIFKSKDVSRILPYLDIN